MSHFLFDFQEGHVSGPEASVGKHGVSFSPDLVPFIASMLVLEHFSPFYTLNNKEEQMVLHGDLHVCFLEGFPILNGLISLRGSTHKALQSMWFQIVILYISKNDDRLLSGIEKIVISHHNDLLSTFFKRDIRFLELFQCIIN